MSQIANEKIILAMTERKVTKQSLSVFLGCPALCVQYILRLELADEEQQRIIDFIESHQVPERSFDFRGQPVFPKEPKVKTKEDFARLCGSRGIRQWEVARELGIDNDAHFSRKTRNGFTQPEWDKVLEAIETITKNE